MKFYNPFKPHIVQFGSGKYAIRKRTNIFWTATYLDADPKPQWWFCDEFVDKYCLFDTLYAAEYRMYQLIVAENKTKQDRKVTVL